MGPSPWPVLNPGKCAKLADVCLTLLIGSILAFAVWMLLVVFFARGVLVLTFFPFAGLVILISILHGRQSSHVATANRINAIRTTLMSETPYVLFLRSFSSELRREKTYLLVEHEHERRRIVGGEIFETGRKEKMLVRQREHDDDVVKLILELFADIPVVVIDGQKSELNCRPLTILSEDDNWRQIYEILAKGAVAIVIMPEPSPSLQMEMQNALLKHREKITFFMPPTREIRDEAPGSLQGATRRNRWSQVQKLVSISLPDYKSSGAFLRPGIDTDEFESSSLSKDIVQSFINRSTASSWTLERAYAELQKCNLTGYFIDSIESKIAALPRSMKTSSR